MRLNKTVAAILTGAVLLGTAAPSTAQDMLHGADAIAKRQELMRSNGMSLRAAGRGPGAEAAEAAETIAGNLDMLADLWPEDSMTGDTKALPAIWDDMEGFRLALNAAQSAAAGLVEATQGTDADAYRAAFRTMGAACGNCHQAYQAD